MFLTTHELQKGATFTTVLAPHGCYSPRALREPNSLCHVGREAGLVFAKAATVSKQKSAVRC